uniref:Uncharacterized protein n=1 Tax=Setaria viridis TaxID=4556 RepID=A0A4U6UL24_SETVI|nr:hypothetical protein SEVIR_5G283300v2 [Setaria viridis]
MRGTGPSPIVSNCSLSPPPAHHGGVLDAIIDDDRMRGERGGGSTHDGRCYGFKCVYAEDTGFYCLTGAAEYERFMADNNMVKDIEEGKELFMELWAFRTPALRLKGGGRPSVGGDHPDRALRMVILFFNLDAEGLGNELFDDDSVTIKQLLRHYPNKE